MQFQGNVPSLRSSSSTLYSRHHSDADTGTDGIAITQELLRGSSVQDRSGFTPEKWRCMKDPVVATDLQRGQFTQSSNTWTSLSTGPSLDHEDVEDRTFFTLEYKRLAEKVWGILPMWFMYIDCKQHGIQSLATDQEQTSDFNHPQNVSDKSSSWFSRKVLRKTSSTQTMNHKMDCHVRTRRSMSEFSIGSKATQDTLKDKTLDDLVRLCGSSLLHLPADYAARSLAIPTCLRATAQYLVQHGPFSAGVFRIPGSHQTVTAIYNHYCPLGIEGEVVAGTVHCPILPAHIICDVHDVASAFKKFISGVPGGILGSLWLFHAFTSIETQLSGSPELTRTKTSKVRARLVALAIASIGSQHRRELICAVFGLVSFIGRAAETARREDDHGRPLPTSGLMGYTALGVCFGPLLINDLLDKYNPQPTYHQGGSLLSTLPSQSRKETHRNSRSARNSPLNMHVDKLKRSIEITEMLITHWREIVRHMKNLGALDRKFSFRDFTTENVGTLAHRLSASKGFKLREATRWNSELPHRIADDSRSSPAPKQGSYGSLRKARGEYHDFGQDGDSLTVQKQRKKYGRSSKQKLSQAGSRTTLSPMLEEKIDDGFPGSIRRTPKAILRHLRSDFDDAKQHLTNIQIPCTAAVADPICHTAVSRPSDTSLKLLSSSNRQARERQKLQSQLWLKTPRFAKRPHSPGSRSGTPQEPLEVQGTTVPPNFRIIKSEMGNLAQPKYSKESTTESARRLTASDPTFNANIPTGKQSSLRSSPAWRAVGNKVKKLFTNTTDPLAQVSHEEDLASLATLADAMSSVDATSKSLGNFTGNVGRDDNSSESTKKINDQKDPVLISVLFPETSPSLKLSQNNRKKTLLEGSKQPPRSTAQNRAIIHDAIFRANDLEQTRSSSGGRTGVAYLESTRSFVRGSSDDIASAEVDAPAMTSSLRSLCPTSFLKSHVTSLQKDEKENRRCSDHTSASGLASAIIVTPHHMVHGGLGNSKLSRQRTRSVRELAAKFEVADQYSTPGSLSALIQQPIKPLTSSPGSGIFASYTTVPSQSPSKSATPVRSLTSAPLFPAPDIVKAISTPRYSRTSAGNPNIVLGRGATVERANALSDSHEPPIAQFVRHQHPAIIDERVSIPSTDTLQQSSHQVRNNSILHAQIRALQRQLSIKVEEVQQLKRQLDTKNNLDIGTLSEQLRVTKRNMFMWKSRAEYAENRFELRRCRPLGFSPRATSISP